MKKNLWTILLDLAKNLLAWWRAKNAKAEQAAKVEKALGEQADVDTHRPVSTDVDDILGRLSDEHQSGAGTGPGDPNKRNSNDR